MRLSSGSAAALAAAVAANVLWGSTFMASKVVLRECPASMAIFIRFAIALLAFGVVASLKPASRQWDVARARALELFALGAVGYTALYLLQMIGLEKIASSQSAAIMLLAPVFTLLLESTQRKSMRSREVAATAFGLAGAAAILLDRHGIDMTGLTLRGLWMTVAAAGCLGVSVVQTRRLLAADESGPGFTVFNLTLYSMAIGVCGLLPFIAWRGTDGFDVGRLSVQFWLWSTYLGMLCSVAAFLMWNWAIKHVSPAAVAVAMYLKTPVALGLGAALLGERLTPAFYGGTTLILGSLFVNQLAQARAAR